MNMDEYNGTFSMDSKTVNNVMQDLANQTGETAQDSFKENISAEAKLRQENAEKDKEIQFLNKSIRNLSALLENQGKIIENIKKEVSELKLENSALKKSVNMDISALSKRMENSERKFTEEFVKAAEERRQLTSDIKNFSAKLDKFESKQHNISQELAAITEFALAISSHDNIENISLAAQDMVAKQVHAEICDMYYIKNSNLIPYADQTRIIPIKPDSLIGQALNNSEPVIKHTHSASHPIGDDKSDVKIHNVMIVPISDKGNQMQSLVVAKNAEMSFVLQDIDTVKDGFAGKLLTIVNNRISENFEKELFGMELNKCLQSLDLVLDKNPDNYSYSLFDNSENKYISEELTTNRQITDAIKNLVNECIAEKIGNSLDLYNSEKDISDAVAVHNVDDVLNFISSLENSKAQLSVYQDFIESNQSLLNQVIVLYSDTNDSSIRLDKLIDSARKDTVINGVDISKMAFVVEGDYKIDEASYHTSLDVRISDGQIVAEIYDELHDGDPYDNPYTKEVFDISNKKAVTEYIDKFISNTYTHNAFAEDLNEHTPFYKEADTEQKAKMSKSKNSQRKPTVEHDID